MQFSGVVLRFPKTRFILFLVSFHFLKFISIQEPYTRILPGRMKSKANPRFKPANCEHLLREDVFVLATTDIPEALHGATKWNSGLRSWTNSLQVSLAQAVVQTAKKASNLTHIAACAQLTTNWHFRQFLCIPDDRDLRCVSLNFKHRQLFISANYYHICSGICSALAVAFVLFILRVQVSNLINKQINK